MIDLTAWEDPAWTTDMATRRREFAAKIDDLLHFITPGIRPPSSMVEQRFCKPSTTVRFC